MRNLQLIIVLIVFGLIFIGCKAPEESSLQSTGEDTITSSDNHFTNTSSDTSNSCPNCIVLYIDKESLSKYKTNNYLLLDPFEGHRQNGLITEDFEFYHESGSFPDLIDLTENAPTLGETFTIEMWIFPDRLGEQHQRIIGPTPHISFHMAINEASEIRYGLNRKSIRVRRIIKNVDWYHVAITYDSNDDFIFYLNGEEVDRYKHLKGRGISPDNATRYIGGKEDGGKFLGKIDDVRMWNVVRSQEQIKETIKSRNQPKTGNEPGYENLVAYYPMDLNDDNATWELVDLSPRGNNVKLGRYGAMSRADRNTGKFDIDNDSTRSMVSGRNSFIINEEIRPRYFSDDCPDGPDGSLTCPFPTIRSSMDNLYKRIKNGQYGGYHLYIREGRYTEVLNKWHFNRDNQLPLSFETSSGEQVARSKVGPIVFEGYPNEKVIIDGTVALNDNSSNWQQASHLLDNGTSINIYKTVINFDNISREIKTPISSIYQLFVNDRYMIPAMPMNFKNPTDPTTGNPKNPEPNTIWSLSQRTEEEAIEQVEDEGTIDEENIDNSTLYDNASMEDMGFVLHPRGRPGTLGGKYVPGSLEFFDGVEEWAFDNNTKTLYLYASDNFTPNSTNVRIRVRDRFVNIRNSENITFKNIDFFAGSITIRGTKHFTLENCRFSFNSDMGLLHNEIVYSPISTVRNCIFEYINDGHSWSQQLSGHPVLENVLFRYNDWFGGTAWSPNSMGDSAQWRYITIENSYTAGLLPGPGSLVEYARLENL
ncbi:MAG: LamG domain-containing protein, partial [SAR324 cluster bacterium]|nr:LamG domain-containing protein [SAR324 cluster bacterium]